MLPSPPHCATSLPPGAAPRAGARTAARGRRSSGRSRSRGSRRRARRARARAGRPRAGRPPAQPLAGGVDHRGRLVDRDHVPARAGARSAPAVIRPEPQPASSTVSSPCSSRRSSTARPSASIVPGDAVVAGSVPLAYWHTIVRYHVPLSWGLAAAVAPSVAPASRPACAAELGDHPRELPALPGDRRADGARPPRRPRPRASRRGSCAA